jgi:acyl-[acyl-carrier-protein]-phospholipid O-acyltransferase/long-chain-fatty-acid--[acyl-carrier-protein] ligase
MRTVLRWLIRLLYGFRAFNEAALRTPGPVLLLPNHSSWWDWLLMGVCLEEDWRFVTARDTADRSWLHRRIMINRRTFAVDMNSPYAVKHMAEYLQKGGRLVLFPEGRLSRTGSLMKLFDGTGFLIFKTHAKVITAYIRGAKRLPFSPNPGLKQWFPRISIHFSPVLTPPKFGHISVTEWRGRLTDWLYDRMVRQQFETEMEFGPPTIPGAIRVAARPRARRIAVQDSTMQALPYRRLLTVSHLFGQQWAKLRETSERRVGVLLPNVNAMPVTLLSLWAANKIPAVLNYSTGPLILLECARLAKLKQIITSRAFVERLALDLEPFRAAGIEPLFLEDVRAGISTGRKLAAAICAFFRLPFSHSGPAPTDTAVVLFTSGSEGTPKAVELTHRNVLANIRQLLSVMDILETDRLFNAMPLFHSFGMAIGLLLPLIEGAFVFLYVSPLHYRVVPSAIYNLNCTIFFGTNTFLAGYARKAHPYDFHMLRYLFTGAEKLQQSTAALWQAKFGIRILEGYGATECSPGLCLSTPMRQRPGSAGQFLPGIEHRLEPVEGIALEIEAGGKTSQVGRLFVRGPNVMRGYLNPEANAAFQALGGWYDTGDIVRVDFDGYVYILGRLKRFAKVSGEMVSLTAVEDALAGAFPQYGLHFGTAVIARPDEAKGEKLIAVTNESRLTLEQVREAVRARGLGNLAVPREIKIVRELPRLGSGKVNHRELEKMV